MSTPPTEQIYLGVGLGSRRSERPERGLCPSCLLQVLGPECLVLSACGDPGLQAAGNETELGRQTWRWWMCLLVEQVGIKPLEVSVPGGAKKRVLPQVRWQAHADSSHTPCR